jgi:hypothetical protein
MLEAWHGEAVPCTRGVVGLATKLTHGSFSVWASKTNQKDRHDGDGIRVHQEALKQGTHSDHGACVGGKQGPMDACPPDGDIYNFIELPLRGVYLLFKL